MSYSWTSGFTGAKFNSLSATTIEPMPGAKNLTYIHCNGATFLAGMSPFNARMHPGDGIVVHNSVSGNNGTYLIVGIPDEEVLLVRGTLASEGAGPTLSGVIADHAAVVSGETTTNWETIVSAIGEPAVADRWEPLGAGTGGDPKWNIVEHTLADIHIHQPGAYTTDFESLNEVVICRGLQSSNWNLQNTTGDEGINLVLGELASSDRRSYYNGSVWFMPGFVGVANTYSIFAYGSTLLSPQFQMNAGTDGQFYGVHMVGLVNYANGSQVNGSEFQDVVQTNNSPPQLLDKIAYSDNFILGNSTNQSLLFGGGLGTVTTVQKMAFADSLYSPYPYRGIFLTFEMRDPQEDYSILDLFEAFASAEGQKTYTYNPQYVDHARSPVSGATVYINQIDDSAPTVETAISGSPFRTNASGQINNGDGKVLLLQSTTTAGVKDDYTYHVTVMAPGFRVEQYKTKPDQGISSDKVVYLYHAALEGEEATL